MYLDCFSLERHPFRITPTLHERSERFLSTLSNNASTGNMEPVDIIEALRTTADIHNLRIDIQGSGQVLINQQSLNSICDNLLGNYIDQNRRNPEIERKIEISIIDTDSDLERSQRQALFVAGTSFRAILERERLWFGHWPLPRETASSGGWRHFAGDYAEQ
jgi:hypothetical protein